MSHKLTLIDKSHPQLSVREQCELLQLNRSSLYWNRKPEMSDEDLVIMNAIDKLYTRRPFYGIRRITDNLMIPGMIVNHKRVHRLMQIMGIQAVHPKPNLSKADKQHMIYPYLLKGMPITHSNQVWGTDITYVRVQGSFLYLVAILDWFSRYVVSWELSDTLEVGFCLKNLSRALQRYHSIKW